MRCSFSEEKVRPSESLLGSVVGAEEDEEDDEDDEGLGGLGGSSSERLRDEEDDDDDEDDDGGGGAFKEEDDEDAPPVGEIGGESVSGSAGDDILSSPLLLSLSLSLLACPCLASTETADCEVCKRLFSSSVK
jgi:hypothetical protein